MKRKSILLGLILLFMHALSVHAQVYTCDFESAQERSQWHLNYMRKTQNIENKWYLGQPGQFGVNGSYGLYVSSDADSARAVYVSTKNMIAISYRDLTLTPGQYTFMMDYQIGGSANGYFQVWWLPQTVNISSANITLPNWKGQQGVDITPALYDSGYWTSISRSFTVTANNQNGRLVVVWVSSAGTPTWPSACVDHIAIFQGTTCTTAPKNVAFTQGQVTWQSVSTATAYEVVMYNTYTGTFTQSDTVTTTSCTPTIANEGYHVIYVRSLCDDGYSEWSTVAEFCYIPGSRCLDYMDLNSATCYYGPFDNPTQGGGAMQTKLDFGYSSVESHHTIHYLPTERDPRTNNRLRTVPQGELASVRLGNWKADNSISGQGAAEAIEYQYTVTAGSSDIMVLKYAVVMQKPGHNDGSDPHFTLEILDNGQPIQPHQCFKADFAAQSNNPAALVGWQEVQSQSAYGTPVIWKDWDTISVSLRNFVGKTLTIRFTTKDCRQSAHWAYAYFTIGCRNGSLEGIACGDFSTDQFEAPEGFLYEWYKASDPNTILGTDQIFHITNTDTCIYVVDVISQGSQGCYYSLTANPNPRYAHANFIDSVVTHDRCTNRVLFANHANVSYINRHDFSVTVSDEPLEQIVWYFGDGSAPVKSTDALVYHNFPDEGGTFTVTQIASMSGGVCADTMTRVITLPDITALERVDSVAYLCDGETFSLPNKGGLVTQDTVYTWFTNNPYGCFVENKMDVRFLHEFRDTTRFKMCEGDIFNFEGRQFAKTGVYTVNLLTKSGCDSVRVLELDVTDRLEIETYDTIYVCADERMVTLPFGVVKGLLGESVVASFGQSGQQAGFGPTYMVNLWDEVVQFPVEADTLRAGYYEMELDFSSECAPFAPTKVVVAVQYATTIMECMDGILAIYNQHNNGNYAFTGFQWYCNGEKMEGETNSYLMLGDEHIGNEYYCVLTRDDGVVMASCPIVYDAGMGTDYIEADDANYQWFDILGRKTSQPQTGGVYIRVSKNGGKAKKMIY